MRGKALSKTPMCFNLTMESCFVFCYWVNTNAALSWRTGNKLSERLNVAPHVTAQLMHRSFPAYKDLCLYSLWKPSGTPTPVFPPPISIMVYNVETKCFCYGNVRVILMLGITGAQRFTWLFVHYRQYLCSTSACDHHHCQWSWRFKSTNIKGKVMFLKLRETVGNISCSLKSDNWQPSK